ncbi:hypothetical protein KC853_03125, partial [Candidatus Saccharibacteria bacterium]|nr:hypothetical protein [Candidatus Saccharibacteria bacterium]
KGLIIFVVYEVLLYNTDMSESMNYDITGEVTTQWIEFVQQFYDFRESISDFFNNALGSRFQWI